MYRTLYSAAEAITCLREVLADLRPSARMLADMEATVGRDAALATLAGTALIELTPDLDILQQVCEWNLHVEPDA